MKLSFADRFYQYIIRFSLVILSITCLYPLLYVIFLSLTSEKEWVENNGLVLFPRLPTLQAYVSVITKTPVFMNSLMISIGRVIIGTAVTLLFTLIMGYILSRRKLAGRKFFLILVLITILFPGGLIPTYLVVQQFGLLDKFMVYIIPVMVDSWGVLVFKQFFENTPLEIQESAQIDGTSEIQLMIRIVLPMSTAIIAAWSLFIAVGQWNAWFDAMLYIRKESLKPLQLIMVNLFQQNLGYDMNAGIVDPINRVTINSLRMAITVVGTIPILMIYPFLQKYFMSGVYLGSVKG